jgi:hypothetical protein
MIEDRRNAFRRRRDGFLFEAISWIAARPVSRMVSPVTGTQHQSATTRVEADPARAPSL